MFQRKADKIVVKALLFKGQIIKVGDLESHIGNILSIY